MAKTKSMAVAEGGKRGKRSAEAPPVEKIPAEAAPVEVAPEEMEPTRKKKAPPAGTTPLERTITKDLENLTQITDDIYVSYDYEYYYRSRLCWVRCLMN